MAPSSKKNYLVWSLFLLTTLLVLGFTDNYFAPSLFAGFNYPFGSIAVMLVLLLFNLFVLVVSVIKSRRLSTSLLILSKMTTDLPERLIHEKISSWPVSRITEVDQLISNVRDMSTALNQKNQEIACINETLESCVEERTMQLISQVRFLETLIDAIPNPIFYKDIEGRYQGCNRAFEKKWGVFREETVGKTADEVFPYQTTDIFNRGDLELNVQGGVQVYETQLRYADNLLSSVVFYKAAYLDATGKIAGLVGTIIDITDRKNAETERDQLVIEFRYKNKELEGIVHVASHDLRSPLVNVQGFSRRLVKNYSEVADIISRLDIPSEELEKLLPILSSSIPRSLGHIVSSVEKMDSLLNGLLRLSRMGRAGICFEQLDMQAIVSKIIESLAFQIELANARVEVDDLVGCLADAGQMNQVFSNLIDNAIKYRSGARELIVRVSSEEFVEGVRYCVEDNGIGIPSDQQDKIWEIFSRLDSIGATGEGLGLTMARRIVDRMGGAIWVESELDAGSRFYVVLPKQQKLDES